MVRAIPWLLFLQSFGWGYDFRGISGVWWTLATEVQFYLLLPLLPALARGRLGVVLLAIFAGTYAIFAAGLVTRWVGLAGVATLSLSVIGRSPLLLCGIGAAGIHAWWGDDLRARWAALGRHRRLVADVLLVLVLLVLAILLRWAVAAGLVVVELPRLVTWHILEGLLWASVLLLLLLAPGGLARLFTSAPLVSLGVISYSVYLLHFPALVFSLGWLQQVGWGVRGWGLPAACAVIGIAVVCLAVSTATYYGIERPAQSWRPRTSA